MPLEKGIARAVGMEVYKFSYPKHIFKYGDKVKRYNGEIGIVVELLKDYNSGNFTNYEMYRVDITDLNGKIVKRGILMAQHELTLSEK